MSDLPPVIRAVYQQLAADAELGSLAPGGIHFLHAPQDAPLPCVLLAMPAPASAIPQFGGTAYDEATVMVLAADELGSAIAAQGIADRVNALLEDVPLPLEAPWHWMSTVRVGTYATEVAEGDLAYQQRGASYRIQLCHD